MSKKDTPINGDALSREEKAQILKDMDMDKIIAWCSKNNELEWLEKKMQEKVQRKRYPYVKVRNEKGKLVCKLDENGCRIPDYSKPPKISEIPIGFMEVKKAFVQEFMPGLLAPKTAKSEPTMLEKLAAAKKALAEATEEAEESAE